MIFPERHCNRTEINITLLIINSSSIRLIALFLCTQRFSHRKKFVTFFPTVPLHQLFLKPERVLYNFSIIFFVYLYMVFLIPQGVRAFVFCILDREKSLTQFIASFLSSEDLFKKSYHSSIGCGVPETGRSSIQSLYFAFVFGVPEIRRISKQFLSLFFRIQCSLNQNDFVAISF